MENIMTRLFRLQSRHRAVPMCRKAGLLAAIILTLILVVLYNIGSRSYSSGVNSGPLVINFDTRRMVLLATHRMNQIVQERISRLKRYVRRETPCSKWWANPLELRRNVVLASFPKYVDRELEFVVNSEWEQVTFVVAAREHMKEKPTRLEFFNNGFRRKNNGTNLKCSEDGVHDEVLTQLCSCDQGLPLPPAIPDELRSIPSWPVNASFMVGDYLDFNKGKGTLKRLFNILPPSPAPCGPTPLLILIISASNHTNQRQAIRTTFGSKAELDKRNLTMYFVTGRNSNSSVEKMLKHEAGTHQDIIQGNFMDTYQNMTLKHLSTLAYVYFSCSEPRSRGWKPGPFGRYSYNPPKFILKADDDFFLNFDMALAVAAANPDVELMGSLVCFGTAFRNPNSKYFVPKYIYPDDVYPGFILGGTVLFRADVIPKLLETALTIPFLNGNLDDPYITDLVAKAAGIQPRHSNQFGSHITVKYEDAVRYWQLKTMIHSHMDETDEFHKTWDLWTSPSMQKINAWIPNMTLRVHDIIC